MLDRARLRLVAMDSRQRRLAGLLLLVLVAAATFVVFRNRSQYVPLGPQRTVQTINPKVGVHTRLTDEVEAAKIKRSLEMVREMGAPWIVEYFPCMSSRRKGALSGTTPIW
jgi:hypothetical protein